MRHHRLILFLLGVAGLAGTIWLLAENDFVAIVKAVQQVGWGIVLFTATHLVALWAASEGWRVLFPKDERPGVVDTFLVRWVSESVNTMLPVASVGGEVVRARLLKMQTAKTAHPISMGVSSASVVVALTTGLVATVLLTLMGLGALTLTTTGGAESLARESAYGIGSTLFLLGLLYVAQQRGWLSGLLIKLAVKLKGELADSLTGGATDFQAAITTMYRNRKAITLSVLWHLLSWLIDAAALWLGFFQLGVADAGLAAGLIIESLSSVARAIGFAVPAGLGVQEASFVLLGGLIGIAAPMALALALLRRVRELVLGILGMPLWFWLERRWR